MMPRTLLRLLSLLDICAAASDFLVFDLNKNTVTTSELKLSTKVVPDDPSTPNGEWLSPEYKWFFEYPLPVPPLKQPKFTYTNKTNGALIDYYEIDVKRLQKQIYPNLPATQLIGYDGLQPGPTFIMRKGREAVVRFSNNSPTNVSTHVHGQYNRAPFDGWAADYAFPGQYKDYHYPNAQNARTIWYHDHTEYETGVNVYLGLEGFYFLTDEEEEALKLPAGNYDVPLALSAKQYSDNGTLVYNSNGNFGLPGDVIQVNGQPWPHLRVEPRKYRLRLLNGAVSRMFTLTLHNDADDDQVEFDVIASDCGLYAHSVKTKTLAFSMGERYEMVVDFADFNGKNITMKNARGVVGAPDYAATNLVMRFIVGNSVSDNTNNGAIPSTLREPPVSVHANNTKDFEFARVGGHWKINGVGWADVEHRILTRPELGADEVWVLRNGVGDGNITGVHPVHIHLVDFQILSRSGGRGEVLPYEAAGQKDVVWLAPGETIRVAARYAPWPGVYMFHCHNLVHEDDDMLVAFNVTNLAKWGYDESTVFIDPMEPAFRPKAIVPEDFTDEAIRAKLDWFWSLNAYNRTAAGVIGKRRSRGSPGTGRLGIESPSRFYYP